ncbi:MAG: tetratricopeptide repeat protein [Gammaproteobacteria bacterium]|nr:tetratricopeptide repeat protein [Gammaproteobacteria bacterium]
MMVSGKTVEDALALIEQAWRRRYEAFQASGASEKEIGLVLMRVRRELEEAVAICRELDAKRELSVALGKLGHVEHDAAARSAIYQEAVAVARECGDPMQLAHAVRHLGDVARHAGETAVAERCYEEALGLYRSEAAPPVLDFANTLRPMAILKADTGELEEARELWRKAAELYGAVGVEQGVEEAERWLVRLTGSDGGKASAPPRAQPR